MEINICFVLAVLLAVLYIVSSETTKEPKIVQSKSTHKIINDVSTTTSPPSLNSNLNSLWVYRPNSHHSQLRNDFPMRREIFAAPRSITKLAKTLSMDFNPYFEKDYFEPFEWRPRPITLVALRKNGFVPRSTLKFEERKSTDVAELQSPYNDVSSFWQDEPGESRK